MAKGKTPRQATSTSAQMELLQILLGKYVNARVKEVPADDGEEAPDEVVSPGIRQTLLQWAFEVTTYHLDLCRSGPPGLEAFLIKSWLTRQRRKGHRKRTSTMIIVS